MRLLPTLAVLSLALLACSGGPAEDAKKEAVKPIAVTTSVATTGAVPRTLKVTGQLIALEDADVGAEARAALDALPTGEPTLETPAVEG